MSKGSWEVRGAGVESGSADSAPAPRMDRGRAGVRRGDVARRYSVAEKQALMEEFERSGESFDRFCARRKVSSASLCKWRRQLAESGAAGLEEREPARNSGGRTARARSAEERRRAVEAYAQSGMTVRDFARTWGVSTKTVSRWLAIYRTEGPKGLEPRARGPRPGARARGEGGAGAAKSAGAGAGSRVDASAAARAGASADAAVRADAGSRADPGASTSASTSTTNASTSPSSPRSLPASVHDEIARTKLRFPDFGLKRIRDFLARFHGVSVSTGTVARTLDARKIERAPPPTPRKPRRELPRRFERALANDLWQTDITSFVIGRSRLRVYLIVFLDDFSRFVVSHGLYVYQRGDIAKETLLIGIGRYGKPNEVLSDQGRQYFAWRGKAEFQKLLTKLGIHHAVARAHHPETVGKCERLWESVKREFVERVELEDLQDARERIGHYFAHYNFFRPHQGIDGLVPADRYFGVQDALRKTHEARLVKDELGEALASRARTRAYLFGQIGDEQVSVHGERGELVVHTSSGVRQRIALEELGVSGAQPASLESSSKTTADMTGPDSSHHEKNGRTAEETAKDADADKRNDGGPSQELAIADGVGRERQLEHVDERAPSAPHRQEAAALPPSAGDAAGRARAVAERDERGAAECAPLVRADPGFVAGQADARGRGGELVAAAAAGVAIEPAGAGGDARGSVDPTQEPPWAAGVHDDMQSRRSAGVEQAHRGAFAQERGAGAAGASGGAAADAGGWAAGVFDERDERDEEARDAS